MKGAAKVPAGLSVIEQMAAVAHEKGRSILHWHQLSKDDRLKLMNAMEAAVEIIPDRLELKSGTAVAIVSTGEGREALLADHRHAKTSALYGK